MKGPPRDSFPHRSRLRGIRAAACLATAGPAHAETSDHFPIQTSNDSPIYVTEINWAISPYGPNARCGSFHGVPTECWQQTPDGQWRKLSSYPGLAQQPLLWAWASSDPASSLSSR